MQEVTMFKCGVCNKIGSKSVITKCEKKHSEGASFVDRVALLKDKSEQFRENVAKTATSFRDIELQIEKFTKEQCPDLFLSSVCIGLKRICHEGFLCSLDFQQNEPNGRVTSSSKSLWGSAYGSDIMKMVSKFQFHSGGGCPRYHYTITINFSDFPSLYGAFKKCLDKKEEYDDLRGNLITAWKNTAKEDGMVKTYDDVLKTQEEELKQLKYKMDATRLAAKQYMEDLQHPFNVELINKRAEVSKDLDVNLLEFGLDLEGMPVIK